MTMLLNNNYSSFIFVFATLLYSCSAAFNQSDCNCRINPAEDTFKIVNGTEFYPHKYPWLVSLQIERSAGDYAHNCGGSILNDQWIVTAGHCFFANLTRLSVLVGAHDLATSGRRYKVAQFIQHPDYNTSPVVRNDIALIQLAEPIPSFSRNVQPACLISRNIYFTSNDLYVAGWGVTDTEENETTERPLELQMDHVNFLSCTISWFGLLSYRAHICARANRASPCFGDSGGPLMVESQERIKLYVIGLVSFGNACTDEMPTVFTRVTSYLNWIESIVKSYCKADGQDINAYPR
ncbi:chymotrypsin B-like [Tetranychus urticae]|uniref:Peptidase S1 domain-containing protein n=1 Tax=Tetranychus urticae TaxID=32264 RepID=T1JV28_TETUR|nr:chymotrypsin B-like [Tetranychus urticae]XP_025018523.1 chymotrypsin B-like [Tetranychus urticae]